MVKHISEKRRLVKTYFFNDEIYGQILDSLVIACTDVYFIHGSSVMLTKRNVYPRKDWWGIGGRMISGENPLDSIKRKTKEETGLNLKRNRFKFFGVYSTSFALRKQKPQKNGSHTLNLTFMRRSTKKKEAR